MKTERNQHVLRRASALRQGQSLVEFALVALVFYLLLAAILTFGHLLFVAQGLQQTVDVTARELSRTPLPPEGITLNDLLSGDGQLDTVLTETQVTSVRQIYDERYLVLNLDSLQGHSSLPELVASLPLTNRQLVPLMISDTIDGTRVLRYPGAVYSTGSADPGFSGYTVRVPRVVGSANGSETIELLPVVEEVFDSGESRFSLSASSGEATGEGVVALQINYPYQSASMSSFRPNSAGPFESTLGSPVEAGSVNLQNATLPGTQVQSDLEFGPYAGNFSLGKQAAAGKTLRPYRKIIQIQATYRREIFSE